jgi:hypothetical protein
MEKPTVYETYSYICKEHFRQTVCVNCQNSNMTSGNSQIND